MINDLIRIISQEALLFEDFLSLLDQQKVALIDNDTEALNRITKLQQQKFLESQKLNRQREERIAVIKKTNAIDGDMTVARILEFADESQALQLRRLREAILSLNDRIAEVRNTNAMLLNQSREFISRTMNMLSEVNRPEAAYDANGSVSRTATNVVMDRRI